MSASLTGTIASAVTLIEASEKWCPHARVIAYGNEPVWNRWAEDGSHLKGNPTRCIGARCMAWRWVGWRDERGDVWHFAHEVPKGIHADPTGVCGLAGAP